MIDAVEKSSGRMTAIATFTRDTRSLTSAVRKLTGADAPAARARVRPDGTVARVAPETKGVPFDAVLVADSGKIALAALPVLQKNGARGVRPLGTALWYTEPGPFRVPAARAAGCAAGAD